MLVIMPLSYPPVLTASLILNFSFKSNQQQLVVWLRHLFLVLMTVLHVKGWQMRGDNMELGNT